VRSDPRNDRCRATSALWSSSEGVHHIKQMGGTVISQDEATSQDFNMPRHAIETGCVGHVLRLGQIAGMLVRLVSPTITS
jgi:two-component system chemotaxis response regulator CheB